MLKVAVLYSKRAPGLEALRERVDVRCVLQRCAPVLSSSSRADAGISGATASSSSSRADAVISGAAAAPVGLLLPGAHEIPASAREDKLDASAAAAPVGLLLPGSHEIPASARGDKLKKREAFDAETAALLRPYDVDAVVLLGYLYVITEPLLAAFPDRILNIHDADLTLRNSEGGPRYPGLHATRDAIYAGERETRSSVHVVTAQLDAGPVVVRGEAFPVAPFVREAVSRGEHDIVRAYAYAQREWMMRSSWGELAAEGVRRVVREAAA